MAAICESAGAATGAAAVSPGVVVCARAATAVKMAAISTGRIFPLTLIANMNLAFVELRPGRFDFLHGSRCAGANCLTQRLRSKNIDKRKKSREQIVAALRYCSLTIQEGFRSGA
jgi:hypothetical protein